MDWMELERETEALVRAGQSRQAAEILKPISFVKIPPTRLVAICGIARRCGLWAQSLRALSPIVRPKVRGSRLATSAERIEYAMNLRHAGAFLEADRILSESDLESDPSVLMARGFGCIYRWDYIQALWFFDRFLASNGISDYSRLIGLVNRLACLVYLSDPRSVQEFENLDQELEGRGLKLLRSNVLEIFAQFQIDRNYFGEARDLLKQARVLASGDESRPTFAIEKWLRVVDALDRQSIDQLLELRKEGVAKGDWEILRDLDFHLSRVQPDSVWAKRAYFGTPYPSFRRKLEAVRSFEERDWLGLGSQKLDPWFPGSEEGSVLHRGLVLLLSDLYRPLRPGEIFGAIHADEYFDIDSSPSRVRQMISRLKKWIADEKIPVRLESREGAYALRPLSDSKILFRQKQLSLDKDGFFFGRYREDPNSPQTSEEWATIMKMEPRVAQRVLRRASKGGALRKVGAGRFIRYLVA
ncbi:MAG: hypothetical protein AB7F86_09190 [Bdellovibrionales bacterium]